MDFNDVNFDKSKNSTENLAVQEFIHMRSKMQKLIFFSLSHFSIFFFVMQNDYSRFIFSQFHYIFEILKEKLSERYFSSI
jgi:hypothetical protein